MILATHMLVGAAVGSKVHNYWAVAAITIALHYFLDSLPHWEYHLKHRGENITRKKIISFAVKVVIDFLVGVILVLFFAKNSPSPFLMFFGAIFAILPDGLVFLYQALKKVFKYEPWILKKHYWFHHSVVHYDINKNPKKLGALIEIIVVLIAFYFLLF